MAPELFDIHCHLNFSQFDKDREDVIKRALDAGIWMIEVGTDYESSKRAVEIADAYAGVYAIVGMHPTERLDIKCPLELGHLMSKLHESAKHPKVVAIGECGLDYKFQDTRNNNQTNINLQKSMFKRQIELALEMDKPLMIHCRDAHDDLIKILNTYCLIHNTKLRGNVHFFSGKWEQAQQYFNLGFFVSFTGVITFSRDYDEIIKNAPLDKIMIETDAPFVSPLPYRGQRSEPLHVKDVARQIAKIKNISYETVCKNTTENALRLFLKSINV
ncbi:MAG: TatD family hydrolase [Patescibacteria group bacterium]